MPSYADYDITNGAWFCLQSSPIDAAGGEAMTASVRRGRRCISITGCIPTSC